MSNTIRPWIAALLLVAAGCATPIAPTGGILPKTTPKIVSTMPEGGATLFTGSEIRFDFDRYMNMGSAARALRVEPDLGIPYSIRWRRKSMILVFEESIPDSATVIVSLGVELSDINGNRLVQPYQLAFSTGSTIDSAAVDIPTVSFDLMRGEEGKTVGLFKEDFRDEAAIYVAESDTSGMVRFRYATPGVYRPVLFEDRNRNRKVDAGESHVAAAAPILLSADSLMQSAPITYTASDTVGPALLGVGLLSEQRLRVRFSKGVMLGPLSSVNIREEGREIPAKWLYTDPKDPTVAYARSSEPLRSPRNFTLNLRMVSDIFGNHVVGSSDRFSGTNQPDTTRLRIVKMPPEGFLIPSDSIMVVYSDRLLGTAVHDSLTLIDGERSVKPWKDLVVDENRLLIHRNGGWRVGQSYQVRAWSPQSQVFETYSFRVEDPSTFGALELSFPTDWRPAEIITELFVGDVKVRLSSAKDSVLVLETLPPGRYHLRTWLDLNGNRRWDPGNAADVGEPVFIRRDIPISTRLTTSLKVL